MIQKISQSFMKDMRAYQEGEQCGNIIKYRYVDDGPFDDAEPGSDMHVATYFEFCLSGAMPKSGTVPLPKYKVSALNDVESRKRKLDSLGYKDMLEPYRQALDASKRVRNYLELMGLKIVSAGLHLTNPEGTHEGTIDLVLECIESRPDLPWSVGEQFIVDLKYSALLGDKASRYNKHGWKWSDVQKEYHLTQAIQYFYLKPLPFYFLVVSSANETDIEFFFIPITEEMVRRHLIEGERLFNEFTMEYKVRGKFSTYPSVSTCAGCALFETCLDKHTYPHPVEVNLTSEM